MKNIIFLSLLLLLCICLKAQNDITTISYKALFQIGKKNSIKKFYIDIPSNGQILKGEKGKFTGDYHTEYRILYPDSSIIYITNDNWSGSYLNVENRCEIGIYGYNKKHLLDTINNEGIQKNGRYWRENILGEIVVGYINCQFEKKELYDRVLKSIRRKKKTK